MHTYAYTYMETNAHLIQTYRQALMFAYIYTYTDIHACMSTYIHIHLYTDKHTYTHAYLATCMQHTYSYTYINPYMK